MISSEFLVSSATIFITGSAPVLDAVLLSTMSTNAPSGSPFEERDAAMVSAFPNPACMVGSEAPMPVAADLLASLPKEIGFDFGETLRLVGRTTFISCENMD